MNQEYISQQLPEELRRGFSKIKDRLDLKALDVIGEAESAYKWRVDGEPFWDGDQSEWMIRLINVSLDPVSGRLLVDFVDSPDRDLKSRTCPLKELISLNNNS